jgi:signal transduction histidine kinase
MNAGYSSGWCEACFGLELSALEVTCKARGDESCQFVMGPPDKVAALAREHFGVAVEGYAKSGFDVPTYFERKRAEEEVRRSLDRLRDAQDELVRKERLATVGLLVSGVAHEVNTPLGIAVTATSVLQEELTALTRKFDEASLTKADMRHFLDRAAKAEEMVRSNLERANLEITRFKRVAVDHATEERRRVDLGEYLRQTLNSLRPLTRKVPLSLSLDFEENVVSETYPGALAQIVTNFVTNSLTHSARDDGSTLHVSVSLRARGTEHVLSYRDDGRGMSEEVKARAFQPFFTTKRGSGGTGLGLYIVHTLVSDVLRGKLQLETEPDRGVQYTVTWDAPRD